MREEHVTHLDHGVVHRLPVRFVGLPFEGGNGGVDGVQSPNQLLVIVLQARDECVQVGADGEERGEDAVVLGAVVVVQDSLVEAPV